MHHHTLADLYLRLSLDRDGKTAIERQEADCRAWAERNGLEVRKVHVDRGRSGYKKVDRQGFTAALAAVTSGVVGTLIVWKLDRLSRKGMGEVGNALDDIRDAGGRLVSVMDGLDTSNGSARIVIATLAEVALAESENLGTRVGNAKRYLRSRGQWIGGQPPYGLAVDPATKKLTYDPETSVYARLIADEALDGKAMAKIARLLNEYDILSPRGGQWNAATVMHLLRSPAFAGLMPETVKNKDTGRYTSKVVPYRHPDTGDVVEVGEGIITVAEREKIIAQLESRTFHHAGKRHPKPIGTALLTSIARCAHDDCGKAMILSGNSYRCLGAVQGNTCPGASAMAARVDDYVTFMFLARLPQLTPGDPLLDAIADRWIHKSDPGLFAKRDAITAELADAQARMADLEDARYVRGEFAGAEAIERYGRLANRLHDRIDGLRHDLAKLPTPEADISPLLDGELLRESWEAAEVQERRELLRLAIDRVEVTKGSRGARFIAEDRVRIVWAGAE
ncbi:recombinase family protein [Streptomyces chilikensis]|uniref:recombinase family protein n=1 Tax=Streptomyces chilikensis TaxID=1194079 RepID=UPI000A7E978D|nr:recombinase family protein [Streptomyces chilikensis]